MAFVAALAQDGLDLFAEKGVVGPVRRGAEAGHQPDPNEAGDSAVRRKLMGE
jgi:hypothetical protein